MFFVIIDNRNTDTIRAIIKNILNLDQKYILIGYSKLEELGMKHIRINHSKRNVEYLKRKIHSNTIKGTWAALKKFIPKYNRRKDKIKPYLKEFI
ncbi:6850_t:CDS:2, partial [Scutellospora calospora]